MAVRAITLMNSIKNISDLKATASIIHDARLFPDNIAFDSANNKLEFICWIRKRNCASAENETCIWAAHRIIFIDVESAQIKVDEVAPYYECSTIHFNNDNHLLEVVFHYGLTLKFNVKTIHGSFEETGQTRADW